LALLFSSRGYIPIRINFQKMLDTVTANLHLQFFTNQRIYSNHTQMAELPVRSKVMYSYCPIKLRKVFIGYQRDGVGFADELFAGS
jgi:hypothetical protein